MKHDDAAQLAAADQVCAALRDAGLDVLVDDRDERPGVKFKDADLVGLPVRITIGDKALAEGCVEFKLRKGGGKGDLVKLADVVSKVMGAAQ